MFPSSQYLTELDHVMNTIVFRWRLYTDNPSLLEKMKELNIIREEIKKIMIASYNQGLHDK